MFAIGLAAAAYYIGYKVIGAKGWLFLLPLIILLLIDPALGAMFFLAMMGLVLVGGLLYLLLAFLPQIIGFFIGVAVVFMLIIGFGKLAGA